MKTNTHFFFLSHTVLLRIRNVSDKRCTESQNTYLVDVHESVHHNTIMNTTNKMQLYRLIYFYLSVLHVSGDVFAHHQEHLAVFTVSGSVHPSSCRLVSWFYFQLFQKKIIPFVVCTGCFSEKFHLDWCKSFLSFFISLQLSFTYKRMRTASALHTFILKNIWTIVGLKVLFRIPSIRATFARFC
jgi:hypothetical protein